MTAKKISRQKARQEKKRQAERRKKSTWMFGGAALLIVGLYFVFVGPAVRPPITEGLSDDEVASLPTAPEIGARAPEFTVADSNGNSRSMSEFFGKPIAVVLFHTW